MTPESREPESRAAGGRGPWLLYLAVAAEAAVLLAFVFVRIFR